MLEATRGSEVNARAFVETVLARGFRCEQGAGLLAGARARPAVLSSSSMAY